MEGLNFGILRYFMKTSLMLCQVNSFMSNYSAIDQHLHMYSVISPQNITT